MARQWERVDEDTAVGPRFGQDPLPSFSAPTLAYTCRQWKRDLRLRQASSSLQNLQGRWLLRQLKFESRTAAEVFRFSSFSFIFFDFLSFCFIFFHFLSFSFIFSFFSFFFDFHFSSFSFIFSFFTFFQFFILIHFLSFSLSLSGAQNRIFLASISLRLLLTVLMCKIKFSAHLGW